MEDFIGLVAVFLIFSIPIVAIVGKQFLKYKQMELDKARALALQPNVDIEPVKRELAQLSNENEKLKKRVSNLERIVNQEELNKLKAVSGIENEITSSETYAANETTDAKNPER